MAVFEDRFGRDALDVPGLLARWRARDIGLAGQFRACGGASEAKIEELYDETVAALLERPEEYESEQHLRRTLHRGIKMRAFRLHRDRGRRRERLEGFAPVIDGDVRERDWRMQPERALVAREDDVVIGEFVAELDADERRVFGLVAEGKSWRAIATALGLDEPRARALTRACERKRERFLALYATGRLCGYRSRTIGLLVGGGDAGELAFGQAVAHLRHCRECQGAHGVDVAGLRAAFDSRVAVFLPGPVVAGGSWGIGERAYGAVERFWRGVRGLWAPQGVGRERVAEVAAGGGVGVGAKVVGGVAAVALLAGSAVGVVGSAARGRARVERRAGVVRVAAPRARTRDSVSRRPAARMRVRAHALRRLPGAGEQRTAGGFSYLGVPARAVRSAPVVRQRGGSPFSP